METFKNKSPRKGTEPRRMLSQRSFWEFKNKSPRKGTEPSPDIPFSRWAFDLKTKAPVRGRRLYLMSILYMVAMQLFKNKSPRKGTEAPKTVIMLFFHFHLKTKAPVRGRRPA